MLASLFLLTTGLVSLTQAVPLVARDDAKTSTSDNTTGPVGTEGTKGYTYSKLPAGFTQGFSGTNVDFLANTTGEPTLQAPQPSDPVPGDAAIYHPSFPIINLTDFRIWHDNVKDTNGGGSQKWMKVSPGIYEFSKGSGFPLDWNNNMAFNGFSGWTLDLRGCTFTETRIDGDKEYSDQMLYINNSDDFTILGGTFWFNSGVEMFTQAKVISMTGDGEGTAVLEVDEGYDVDTWGAEHNVGDFNCIDVSNPDHYFHPGCNFWYQSNIKLDAEKRQITADYTSRSGCQIGDVRHHQVRPFFRCQRLHGMQWRCALQGNDLQRRILQLRYRPYLHDSSPHH